MTRQLLQAFLVSCLGGACIATLSSSSSGVSGNVSCGGSGCHSNPNIKGTPAWGVGGLPYPYYEPGKTYNLTVGFQTSVPGAVAGGFDLTVYGGGSIISTSAGTSKNGSNEFYSTAPKAISSGAVSWDFTWVAPTAASTVEFQLKACAVNGNGSADSNDISYQDAIHFLPKPAAPSGVPHAAIGSNITIAPVPAQDMLTVSVPGVPTCIYAIALDGNRQQLSFRATGQGSYTTDLRLLPAGNYHLIVSTKERDYTRLFTKL